MKKILVGLLLGIFLLKTSSAVYSYAWWNAEASTECRAVTQTKQIYECIDKRMGVLKHLRCINMNLNYTWQTWQLRY